METITFQPPKISLTKSPTWVNIIYSDYIFYTVTDAVLIINRGLKLKIYLFLPDERTNVNFYPAVFNSKKNDVKTWFAARIHWNITNSVVFE